MRTSSGEAAFVRTICPPPVNELVPAFVRPLSIPKISERSAEPPAGTVRLDAESETLSPVAMFDLTLYVTGCAPRLVRCRAREALQLFNSSGARPRLRAGGSMVTLPVAAAYASMRPAPAAMMSSCRKVALFINASLTCSGVQSWCSALRSAAAPATCGLAIEVPLRVAYRLPGYEE